MTGSKGSPPAVRPWDAHEVWGAAPCPVLITDPDGVLVAVNPAAREVLPGAEPGRPLRDAVPAWLGEARQAPVPPRVPGPAEQAGPASPAAVDQVLRGRLGDRAYAARRGSTGDGRTVWWLADETERESAEEALREERARTALLAEISDALLSSLNVERCMDVTVRMAATHLADAALLIAPARGRRYPVAHCHQGGPVTHTVLSVDPRVLPGLSEALQGFPPVPSRWIDPSLVPSWAVPDGFAGPIGSVVITPLPGHGVPAGVIVLLRRGDRGAFTDEEEAFARLFAARAGVALSAARMYAEQSRITRTLMRDLLPPTLTHVHGVEFAGGYRAGLDSERVGGDFYDVHPGPGPDDETLAVLGDVCGKGLDAAVLTGKIRHVLQALLPLTDDHGRILELLNSALLTAHHTRFATLVLASVTRRDDGVRVRATSAGHPAPLVVRVDGTVEAVPTRGTLVGALPEVTAETAEFVLAPGETCLLYSDGITEARGGPTGDALFGESRLRRALAECAGLPAEAVVERVQMLATQWNGGGRHDDMAVLAVTAPAVPQRGRPRDAVGGTGVGRRGA